MGTHRAIFSLLGMWLIGAPQCVSAQNAEEAQISGQPLMYMKAGQVDGCGIRFIGISVDGTLRSAKALDASINIYGSGVGAVKGLSYDVAVGPNGANSKHTTAPIERFWIKAPGSDATHPHDGKFHATEDVGGRLYAVTLDSALAVLLAAITDKHLTFGIKRSAERLERIYFGKVAMTQAEKDQVDRCLDDMIVRLSKPR